MMKVNVGVTLLSVRRRKSLQQLLHCSHIDCPTCSAISSLLLYATIPEL